MAELILKRLFVNQNGQDLEAIFAGKPEILELLVLIMTNMVILNLHKIFRALLHLVVARTHLE